MAMHTVEVDVDLDDFEDDELIQELKDRGVFPGKNSKIGDIYNLLKEMGCPEEILDQLNEWGKQPLITQQKLNEWIAFCTK